MHLAICELNRRGFFGRVAAVAEHGAERGGDTLVLALRPASGFFLVVNVAHRVLQASSLEEAAAVQLTNRATSIKTLEW